MFAKISRHRRREILTSGNLLYRENLIRDFFVLEIIVAPIPFFKTEKEPFHFEFRFTSFRKLTETQHDPKYRTILIPGILNRQFGTNQSSPQKGAIGEAWFRQLLIDDPAISVHHVGNNFNQGDFVVSLKKSSVNVMIEVKNSKSNIYGEPKEKFLRDLDSNDQYHCGVLVSCHSGFDLSTEEFKVYRSPKENKPYCFLANLADRKNPEVILKIVLYSLQAYAESSGAKSINEKQFSCLVMSDIKAWQDTLNRTSKRVSEARALTANLEAEKQTILSNFNDLKRKWEDLQNGRLAAGNGGAGVSEPAKKVPKLDWDTDDFF